MSAIEVKNENEILKSSMPMKDYLEAKAFLIEDLFEKDKESAFAVLKGELVFLLMGSDKSLPPLSTTAALLVKIISNDEIKTKAIELLGAEVR